MRLRELAQRREMIPVDQARMRADHVLLRLNLSADVLQLEAELRWTAQARETVTWLLENEVVWPSARGRANAMTDRERDRLGGREEPHARASTTHLRSIAGAESPNRGLSRGPSPSLSA
jgi:hypothetical protein